MCGARYSPAMPPPAAARIVPEGRLRLSKSPTAEIASAAYQAQNAAKLEAADFIIIAVPVGRAGDELAKRLQAVAQAAA